MQSFKSIVITGASSGIGEALALDYAAPGIALALSGRDAQRLDAVAAACRARGAMVDAGRIVVDAECARIGFTPRSLSASKVRRIVDSTKNTWLIPVLANARANHSAPFIVSAIVSSRFFGVPSARTDNIPKAGHRDLTKHDPFTAIGKAPSWPLNRLG